MNDSLLFRDETGKIRIPVFGTLKKFYLVFPGRDLENSKFSSITDEQWETFMDIALNNTLPTFEFNIIDDPGFLNLSKYFTKNDLLSLMDYTRNLVVNSKILEAYLENGLEIDLRYDDKENQFIFDLLERLYKYSVKYDVSLKNLTTFLRKATVNCSYFEQMLNYKAIANSGITDLVPDEMFDGFMERLSRLSELKTKFFIKILEDISENWSILEGKELQESNLGNEIFETLVVLLPKEKSSSSYSNNVVQDFIERTFSKEVMEKTVKKLSNERKEVLGSNSEIITVARTLTLFPDLDHMTASLILDMFSTKSKVSLIREKKDYVAKQKEKEFEKPLILG